MAKYIWDEESEEYKGGDDLYFVRMGDKGPIKIGRATDPLKRIQTLQTGNPERLTILHIAKGEGWQETFWHALFAGFRINGEWFRPLGGLPETIAAMADGKDWPAKVKTPCALEWEDGEYAEHILDALDAYGEQVFNGDIVTGGTVLLALGCLWDHDRSGVSLNTRLINQMRAAYPQAEGSPQ